SAPLKKRSNSMRSCWMPRPSWSSASCTLSRGAAAEAAAGPAPAPGARAAAVAGPPPGGRAAGLPPPKPPRAPAPPGAPVFRLASTNLLEWLGALMEDEAYDARRAIPAVDRLLSDPAVADLLSLYGRGPVRVQTQRELE